MNETYLVLVEAPDGKTVISRGHRLMPLKKADAEDLAEILAKEHPNAIVHVFKHFDRVQLVTEVRRVA